MHADGITSGNNHNGQSLHTQNMKLDTDANLTDTASL